MEGEDEKALQEDLTFLIQQDHGVAVEFARIAVALLLRGTASAKAFAKAAGQLGVEVSVVERAVGALCHLFSVATARAFAEGDCLERLQEVGFEAAACQAVTKVYFMHVGELRQRLAVAALPIPSYKSLEWRLDVQLASRSLHHQAEPSFFLKLSTWPEHTLSGTSSRDATDLENVTQHFLEADYSTLSQVCSNLEEALAEVRSARVRRRYRRSNNSLSH